MSLYDKIRGTVETLFRLGIGGPQLKNNSGAIEHRNAADSAFAISRGADPVGDDDLVTKRYTATITGASGTPTYIPAGTTVTIAQYTQMLFSVVIEVDGVIDGSGVLVEVQ